MAGVAKKRKRGSSRSRPAAGPRPGAAARTAAAAGDGSKKPAASRAQAKRTAPAGAKRGATATRQRLRGGGRLLVVLVAGGVALGGYYLWLWHQAGRPAPPPTVLAPAPHLAARPLPGLQTGPAPWGTAQSDLKARLEIIGLPVLTAEATEVHIHEHLDVFVNGRKVAVPANLGINAAAGYLSPLHTHDDSGLIHVESPTERPYTLGQLFDVWGVRFTRTCLGGYCDRGDHLLRVFVGGTLFRDDPRLLELALHQEIVVTYGTPKQLPHPVPSSYSFPIGA
jgi:hypothetical protein